MPETHIASEGELTTVGRRIEPGALTWENPIPVTVPAEGGQWIVGKANVRRDGEKIMADIEVFAPATSIGVDLTEWVEGEPMVMTTGRLNYIVLGHPNAFSVDEEEETDGSEDV